jgi:hypothetical protein
MIVGCPVFRGGLCGSAMWIITGRTCGPEKTRPIDLYGRTGDMTLQELLFDIHALEEDLLAFERKYGIRSETFYAAYIGGEEPEDESWVLDFTEWASVYRTWLARQAAYRNKVEEIRHGEPGIAGLIRVSV